MKNFIFEKISLIFIYSLLYNKRNKYFYTTDYIHKMTQVAQAFDVLKNVNSVVKLLLQM